LEVLEERRLLSTYYVSPTGNDNNPGTLNQPFKTFKHSLAVAINPGDTVMALGGVYSEKVTFTNSGSAAGDISIEAYPSQSPILDGTGVGSSNQGYGNDMVQGFDISYVQVIGFEIRNDVGTSSVDASGIHFEGYGTNINIENNTIHDITGVHAMGISIYGSSQTSPLTNLTISGNTIYNCQPANSETLTLNGNVSNFTITNNLVHDNNNIGIDMIGGEYSIFGLHHPKTGLPVTRDGVCSNNTVYNIHANYGGGYAGGIYVDGGQNITLADNVSYQNDLGLEVGAENHGYTASGITVEDNLLYNNTQSGLVFGGYSSTVGKVKNCTFISNTVYNNDTTNTGNGQLWIQYASYNTVASNIFYAASNDVLIGSDGAGNNNNTLDYNLYYATSGANNATFNWNAATYSSFSKYQTKTNEDAHSLFADPNFVNAGASDFQLANGSPAIDTGSATTGQFDPIDFTGTTRGTPPDIGAYENSSASAAMHAGAQAAAFMHPTATGLIDQLGTNALDQARWGPAWEEFLDLYWSGQ
jgi:hypothetical protein